MVSWYSDSHIRGHDNTTTTTASRLTSHSSSRPLSSKAFYKTFARLTFREVCAAFRGVCYTAAAHKPRQTVWCTRRACYGSYAMCGCALDVAESTSARETRFDDMLISCMDVLDGQLVL